MKTIFGARDRALAALLLIGAYVGSYFAVLALPSNVRLPKLWGRELRPEEIVGRVESGWDRDTSEDIILPINRPIFPDYHGLPDIFFAPMHKLDRKYVRPDYWWSWPRPKKSDSSAN